MIETANEMVPLLGQRHALIQRVLAWSALVLSAPLALSLILGAYIGNRWNNLTTVAIAGLVTVLVAYYLARWQLNGVRWLMYAYAGMVVFVVAVFVVKFPLNGSASGLLVVAPIVGVAIVVLGEVSSFLRRSEKRSAAPGKRI
jgi:hypothetical protein